ncbi:MAG: Gfo/Idh/MocA family oxidoreductase [Fuerstiella sp.]|nr:Gfo/Idh/MocA family oxidoreductase [Fuerstiella sp.]
MNTTNTGCTAPRSRLIQRRSVFKAAAAAAGVAIAPARLQSASPSEKLNLAFVGVGGRGRANVGALAGQNFVAFADVDDHRAGEVFEKYPSVRRYRDYRIMLDDVGSRLDGVVISTPDHMHFHPTWAAMQLGLHVYVEKPLAHDVHETRILTNYARTAHLATQLGAQRHAYDNMRRVVELIQAGTIGDVTEVWSWVTGNRGMPKIPAGRPSVPAHLDYDLWTGAVKHRPYHPSVCPYGWRFWWHYGSGETGNWGCHTLDIPFWALDLKYPVRVDADGPSVDPERTPTSMQQTFQFPVRGNKPCVTLHWHHGIPKILQQLGLPAKENNTLFIGSDGMLLCGFHDRTLLPEDRFADVEPPPRTIPDSPGFYQEWVNACKGQGPATLDFSYAGPLTETALLGNVAYRAGGFDWDAASMSAGSNQAANALLKTEYRRGWEI